MTAATATQIGLIIVIAVHIVVIARWSGRLDGTFAAYMKSNDQRLDRHDEEIDKLRAARHLADGTIQRHEGMLRELDRRQFARRVADCPAADGDA